MYTFPTVGYVLTNRDLTDGQRQKLDDLRVEAPDCVQKCTDARENNTEPHYIPLCALSDQSTTKVENDPDMRNSYSCLCTDKVYIADNMACIVKNVSSKAASIVFNRLYSQLLVRVELHGVGYCPEWSIWDVQVIRRRHLSQAGGIPQRPLFA